MIIGELGRDKDGYFMVIDNHITDMAESDDNLSTALSIVDLHDAATALFFDTPVSDEEHRVDTPPLPTPRLILTRHMLMPMVSGAVSAGVEVLRRWLYNIRRTPVVIKGTETGKTKWNWQRWFDKWT